MKNGWWFGKAKRAADKATKGEEPTGAKNAARLLEDELWSGIRLRDEAIATRDEKIARLNAQLAEANAKCVALQTELDEVEEAENKAPYKNKILVGALLELEEAADYLGIDSNLLCRNGGDESGKDFSDRCVHRSFSFDYDAKYDGPDGFRNHGISNLYSAVDMLLSVLPDDYVRRKIMNTSGGRHWAPLGYAPDGTKKEAGGDDARKE